MAASYSSSDTSFIPWQGSQDNKITHNSTTLIFCCIPTLTLQAACTKTPWAIEGFHPHHQSRDILFWTPYWMRQTAEDMWYCLLSYLTCGSSFQLTCELSLKRLYKKVITVKQDRLNSYPAYWCHHHLDGESRQKYIDKITQLGIGDLCFPTSLYVYMCNVENLFLQFFEHIWI